MNIAIVGGGAAGSICAYLLDRTHRVTLFERESVLGGNIRTLGSNVSCDTLPEGVRLDAGVIEFSIEHFPTFHRLLRRLEIETRSVPVTSAFTRTNGTVYRSPDNVARGSLSFSGRVAANMRRGILLPEFLLFRKAARAASSSELKTRDFGSFLFDGPASEWLRLLMVYAYSTPRSEIDRLPAALAIPTLLRFAVPHVRWTSIRGGSYTYIERILQFLRGRVVTDAKIEGVGRSPTGVSVRLAEGETIEFDKVVFATTPDEVLRLLDDPNENERRRFAAWRAQVATVVIHDDDGIYEQSTPDYFSEFDVFENPPGYNAYLNRLAGLSEPGSRHYHLSYNLQSLIAPDRVLHEQHHVTPSYDIDSFAFREEVITANGEHDTLFAGAWLGDGLHEGATCSAVAVSKLLGGDVI